MESENSKKGLKWRNSLKDKGGPTKDKLRETRLRWFDRVQRRAINTLMRNSELIQVEWMRKKVEKDLK